VAYVRFPARGDRSRFVASRFGRYLQGRVLDVGCDRAELKALLPGCEYVGVDVAGAPDVHLDIEKADRLPFRDGEFDCVVCVDVLEHLDNLHAVFDELLRVARRHVVVSLPNNWLPARVPLRRGGGGFTHYGLPLDRPADRHKWFFSLTEARDFVLARVARSEDLALAEELVTEKPRCPCLRWLRRVRYPAFLRYLNRYAHTYWAVIAKTNGPQ
jgi:SAM-dependent methyltransferase